MAGMIKGPREMSSRSLALASMINTIGKIVGPMTTMMTIDGLHLMSLVSSETGSMEPAVVEIDGAAGNPLHSVLDGHRATFCSETANTRCSVIVLRQ